MYSTCVEPWQCFIEKNIGKQHKLKHILQVIDLKTQYTKDVIFLQTENKRQLPTNPNSFCGP